MRFSVPCSLDLRDRDRKRVVVYFSLELKPQATVKAFKIRILVQELESHKTIQQLLVPLPFATAHVCTTLSGKGRESGE